MDTNAILDGGVAKCPSTTQASVGCIYYYELVISPRKLPFGELVEELSNAVGDDYPMVITDNLDGSLTLRGFTCIPSSEERDHFRGRRTLVEFREATDVEVQILVEKRLQEHAQQH